MDPEGAEVSAGRRGSDRLLWALFWAASALTLVVKKAAWATSLYWHLLSVLGFLSCLLASAILWRGRLRWRSVGFIALGLILGQHWALLAAWTFFTWSLHGFAP